MLKNAKDKGITLVSLVVTIVILLVLSGIAYQAGKGTVESARLSTTTGEMIALQQKVNELEQRYRSGDTSVLNMGYDVSQAEGASETFTNANITDTTGYRYYPPITLEELGIENSENGYLVNIQKRSIVSLNGVKYKGERYYKLSEMPNGLYNVDYDATNTNTITFDLSKDIQGNGMRIQISNIQYSGDIKKGSIYYGIEKDGQVQWQKVTNDTTDTSYTIDVLDEGTYYVKIVDTAGNESTPQSVTINVANYVVAETGAKYLTLGEATNAAKNNQTIKQLRNYTDSSEVIVEGKSIIFDNNGKTLTKTEKSIVISAGAGLEISGNGTITTSEALTGSLAALIDNNGTLNITHTGTISDTYTGNAHCITNYGTITKTGTGIITGTTAYVTIGVIGENANATISEGTISNTGTNGAMHTWRNSIITIEENAHLVSNHSTIQVGHTNNRSGKLIITGGRIENLSTDDNGNCLNINSGASTAEIIILGGEIIGSKNCINIAGTNNTLTIGNKNAELSTTTPVIQGGTNGITVSSDNTWSFYNGIIKGTTAAYNTEPTEIRNNCKIVTSTETIDGTEYNTAYLVEKERNYSITVGDTTNYYETLQEAVDAAENGQTIKQEKDCTDSSEVVVDGKSIVFDNNGKTLTKTEKTIVVNSGATLEIAGNGTITTSEALTGGLANSLIANNGTLNITHTGTISDTFTSGSHLILNHGIVTKTGSGTLTSSAAWATIGSWNEGAKVTLSAGKIESTKVQAIHSYLGAELKIEGTAQITSTDYYAIYLAGGPNQYEGDHTKATLTMTGGIVKSTNREGISMWSGASNCNVTITGGQVIGSTYGIGAYAGTVTIGNKTDNINSENPVITGGTHGIYKDGSGTWNFYNGVIKGTTAAYNTEPNDSRENYYIKTGTEVIGTTTYNVAYLSNTLTVTYDAQGGTVSPASKEVTYNGTYGTLPTPTRTGYSFAGWSSKNLLNTYDKSATTLNGVTLSASNNTIHVTGTNTKTSDYSIGSFDTAQLPKLVVGQTYTVSLSKTLSGVYVQLNYITNSGGEKALFRITSASTTFTVPNDYNYTWTYYVGITGASGTTDVNEEFTVQLEKGSIATEYEPYRSITASTAVTTAEDHTIYANWTANNYSITNTSGKTYYERLSLAVASAKTGETIVQENDQVDANAVTISGKNIIFNNNGKTLTRTKTITISNGATLEITGSGTIQTSSAINLITNNGTLNITHTGKIENKNTSNMSRYAIYCNNASATTNISGNTTITAYCRVVRATGNFTMTAGTINTSGTAIAEGFTIGTTTTIAATINISGGKIESTNNCAAIFYVSTEGSLTLSDNVEVTSTNTEYSSSAKCVQNGTNTTVNIRGGTYRCINGLTAIVDTAGDSIVNIYDGDIYGTKYGVRNGSANASGTINIYGGNIKGDEAGIDVVTAGTINIGDSTASVNANNPTITGGTYGINLESTSGTWNFYNGILKGTTAGYNTAPATIRENHKITTGTETISGTTYNTAYLTDEFTVTFNANGGTVNPTTKQVKYNTEIGTLPTPTRAGYTFSGWYTAETDGNEVTTTSKMPAEDVIYYAHWTDNTAPAAPAITAKLGDSSGATYTPGSWTKENIYVELTSSDSGSGIKEFQWYENDAWTTRSLTTTGDSATITYTVTRDTTLRFRVIDNDGNISEESTIAVKMDKTKPTITASGITYGQNLSITLKDANSGVTGWQVTNSNTAPTSGWTEFDAAASKTVSKPGLDAGTWYIWVKDAAGNTQSKAITVSKAEMTVTSENYTGAYDGNSHTITGPTATTPSSGTKVYYSTTTELTSSNYKNTSVASTTKPTRTDAGTTTVYWYVESNNGNYNDKSGSNTITISASETLMSYTSSDYNEAYDGNSHSITLNVTTPTGCTLYYSTTKALTGESSSDSYYETAGTTTKPTRTTVGTTTVYWYIKSSSPNYADKAGSNKIIITQATVEAPTNVTISSAGIVSWPAVANATSYEISTNASSGFTDIGNVTSYDYLSTLTASTGSKTVYVRAKNSDTSNYTSPSSNTSGTATVVQVKIQSNSTTMGAVDTATYNVISGATVSTSTNKLTINGVTTGSTTTALKTITATPTTGYSFSSWSKTSGGITAATTITATFTANTYTIAYTLNDGTAGANAPTSGTYDSNVEISNPTKTGYTFAGWTYANGTTSTAKYGTSSSAVTTAWSSGSTKVKATFFKNLRSTAGTITLTANWTANTNTAYVVNHYKHDYGANTYTLESTENKTGTTAASLTLANLKKTITGYTYVNGFANAGDTTKPTSGAVSSTTILADGSRVINLYYRPNYLYVQYDMNGGSLGESTATAYTESGSLVANSGNVNYLRGFYGSKVGTVNTTTFATATTSGLHDYNNSSGINIVRSGYTAQVGAQWSITADGTGTAYSQTATNIDATAMATAAGFNLGNGDVTVTLYVNWVAPNWAAYNGSTRTAYYPTLADAVTKATSGYTIKPEVATLTDASSAGPSIPSSKTLTIDLNGKTVTMSKTITNAGTLTITGTGTLTASAVNNITNSGIFTKSGTSTISNTATATYYTISNTGTANLSAGTVTSTYRAVNNGAAGKLNVNGATVSSTTSNITIYSTGTATGTTAPAINISSGTVSSAGSYAIQNAAAGHVYVTGGSVTTTGATVIYTTSTGATTIGASGSTSTTSPEVTGRIYGNATAPGDVTVNGGKITATSSQAILNKGNIIVKGGNISATSSYTIYSQGVSTAKITISGGTITSANSYAVTSQDTVGATIEISGGTITRTAGTTGAINNRIGTTTITGGTIKANAGVGVYVTTGTVTLGTNNSTILETPSITGATWGVQVTDDTGKFYFYDGTITGKKDQSISKDPTSKPSGYVVRKTVSGTTETATLSMTLKENYSASATGAFLGTGITRDKIKKVSFTTSISGHTVNNTTCWDVSSVTNGGQVLMWIASGDATNGYEIAIGQNGGVLANPTSSFLFGYIGNSISAQIDLTNLNTEAVTTMQGMFYECNSLTSLDLSNFYTAKVTDMTVMFEYCSSLTSLDLSSFNTASVTYMDYMFDGCSRLISLDVSGFDTSNVVRMLGMFCGCHNISTLDVSGFDTTKVTNMGFMFSGCENISTLDVSGFDTTKVTDMDSMFNYCSSLTSLDLSNFNTSNVTTMSGLFEGSRGLTNINFGSINTSSVTSMRAAFWGCSSLKMIDLSSFNTSSVTDMSGMFKNCSSLTTIYASSSFVTTSITSGSMMFENCSAPLKGGAGTTYSSSYIDYTYAHIDGGTSNPGYFTDVSAKPTISVGGTNIKNITDITTKYGQTTTYKSTSHPNIDWQLFYADSSNYYLIASDYVPNAELPCNGNTVNGVTYGATDLVKSTVTTNQHATYGARFCSNSNYNDGVLTTGTIYKNGSSSTAITNNPLSSTYLKWANTYNTSTNNNICSVAYMMDTNKWSSFADGVSGAYAMGGPTVEMFVLSYNAVNTHTTKLGTYETVDSNNSNSNGYMLKIGTGSWASYVSVSDTSGTDGNMWVRTSQAKAYGCWLASPSSGEEDHVRSVGCYGRVDYDYATHGSTGFRPLVAIPKTAIK